MLESGEEAERKEASQVVLENSTCNAVYQSPHRSCHIITFPTNIQELTFYCLIESFALIHFLFIFSSICVHAFLRVSMCTRL